MSRTLAASALALSLVGLGLVAPATAATGGAAAAPYWSSEFNGVSGSRPTAAHWTPVTGGGGWGNGDLQTYTASTRNAVVRNGMLQITARREVKTGTDGITRNYTSARLETRGKFTMKYGRVEARIKIPRGVGLFPAFWMLGSDFDRVGWPRSGEFDIMENNGRTPRTLTAGFHGPGMLGAAGSHHIEMGAPLADAFHVYGMRWGPDSVSWTFDGRVVATATRASLPRGAVWVFDKPFYLLLNVAVGGNWPGTPPATTVFPTTMSVDWVRVYR